MSCSKKYEYAYYESQIVAQVVLAGRDEALIDGAREFTDWAKPSGACHDSHDCGCRA